ncbi:MAG: 5'-nucleotidase C-terminal domain-containing protein [Bryobacterales bacterium]|nr:5'-nucleotidase C-terminal domain-containing protein [Bryobacterales bacterium]
MFLSRLLLLLGCALACAGQTTRISVLVTTDLHGNLYPWDYFTAKPANRGLAKVATLIREQRQENPNTLLVDCGDTIQGAPLEAVYQQYVRTGKLPHGLAFKGKPLSIDPMMLAMNALGFDAMALGNHEFNFGLKNLEAARKSAKFPWLSANTVAPSSGMVRPFEPYVVKTVAGVKVAIIGITTPAVPSWEKPENYKGLRFLSGVEAVEKAIAELKTKHQPDLVVVASHAGLDRDLKTGEIRTGETGHENMVYQTATKVKGIDAIVFGHTHQVLEEARLGDGVLLHQPKNWGISMGRVDFEMEKVNGKWRVASKKARLIPVTDKVEADPEILALAKPYHELTEEFLNTPVAESPVDLDGSLGRVADTALVDAVQQVQLHYAKADVSLTAMFNPRVRFPKGPVTVRQVAALYVYDNELYVIEGNGKMLKDALENAARYYLTCPDTACSKGPLVNSKVIGFNYDMAQGVEYEIDLTQPEGSRVRNVRFRGKPLEDQQPLRIAVNNYRAGGSAGYRMFRDARVLWKSGEEIRNLIIEYYTERKKLPAKADGNWRIIPESARKLLETESRAEAARSSNY